MICIHCSEHIIHEKRQKKYVCVYIDGPPEGNWCQLPHPKNLTRSKVRVKTHSKILCVRNVPNGERITPQSSTILVFWSMIFDEILSFIKKIESFRKIVDSTRSFWTSRHSCYAYWQMIQTPKKFETVRKLSNKNLFLVFLR